VVEKYGDKPNLDIIVNKNIEIKLDAIDENSVSLPNQIQKVEEEPIEPEVKKEITVVNEPIKKDNLKDDYKVYDF
jgi:hypothetical protein